LRKYHQKYPPNHPNALSEFGGVKLKMSTSIFREAFFGVIQMRINSIFRKYPEG